MTHPWERQPDEGSRAYAAFKAYLELGPQRSHAKVAEKLGKSIAIIARWSRVHGWVDRCTAWEVDQDAEWLTERQRCVREACKRHATIARAFTGKLAAYIKSIEPAALTPADAARWLEVAVKVERLGLGMSTNNTQHTGKDGGPIDVDVSARRDMLRPLLEHPEGQQALNKLADLASRADGAHGEKPNDSD